LLQRLPLSSEDGDALIKIVESEIGGDAYMGKVTPRLSKRRPVFVSVYQNGSRIACLGYTKPFFAVYESVGYLARGINIDQEEGHDIVITIFDNYEEHRKGDEMPPRRGVMVRKEGFEGVVLPLTFEEKNLTEDEALELAAQKAGFSHFSWDDFEVFTFDAQLFKSEDY
ncbi:MAG: AMMECR1 domain-containing protein, partial [Candidatus Hydrothermarchaeales archaeon]